MSFNEAMNLLLMGYFGFGNLGDDLILESMLKEIHLAEPKANITVFSYNPFLTRKCHGTKCLSFWNPVSLIQGLKKNEIFILGGGGLFQDVSSIFAPIFYACMGGMARLFKHRVFLYAVGVEELAHSINRMTTRLFFQWIPTRITVRDQESKNALRTLGVRREDVIVTADPVWALPFNDASMKERPRRGTLIIFHHLNHIHQKSLVTRLKPILIENNLTPIRLGCLFSSRDISKYELDGITHINSIEDIMTEGSLPALIISARYHGLILASRMGIPCMGMGSLEKIQRLCLMLKIPRIDESSNSVEMTDAIQSVLFSNLGDSGNTPLRVEAKKTTAFLFPRNEVDV